MHSIQQRLAAVRAQIKEYEQRYNREPDSVSLLAVSKTKPAAAVLEASQAGQRSFGENYHQDALKKMTDPSLVNLDLEWHFIGPLQSNKTRPVAEHYHWLHSLDRLKIARRLSEQRPIHLPPLQICLQVKLRDESTKSGLSPDQAQVLADQIVALPNLKLRGLMTLPPASEDLSQQRKPFQELRELLERLNQTGHELDTLSMGMTHDMEAAIAEGATLIRIGTAIFGSRQ